MSGFIEVTDIGSNIGAADAPILINTDAIAYVVQGCRVPGDEGVSIILKSGKEIGVAETFDEVKKNLVQALIEERAHISITHTENGEFLMMGNKIYRRTKL